MIDITKHIAKNTGYSSHFKVLNNANSLLNEILQDYLKDHPNASFLDVGGGSGRHAKLAKGYKYFITDITPRPNSPKNLVVSDITNCPEIPDNSYDVVFSHTIFEHIIHPWKAGTESVRIVKPDGLIICIAPFSWRYHPVPVDAFRFTHTGMQILFTQDNNVETIFSGYDMSDRRKDIKGFWENKLDKVPVDGLGGFRENILTVYIGQKKSEEVIEKLDSDYTVTHK